MSDDDGAFDSGEFGASDDDTNMDLDVGLEDDDGDDDAAISEDDAAFYEAMGDGGVEKEASNYRSLSPAELAQELEGAVTRVAEMFELPAPTARLLLQHCKWNETRCVERLSEDEARLFTESDVPNPKDKEALGKSKKGVALGSLVECTICFNDFKFQEACRVACGHSFCPDCWGRYLEVKISDGQVAKVTCAAKGCRAQLDSAAVAQLLTRANRAALLPKYHKLALDAYVLTAANLRWCPGKGCANAVRVEILKEKEVLCSTCHTKFCFGCGALPHAPCDCDMMAGWNAKCSKDGDDLKWLAQFTKECPKCKAVIHKDGGCQYMTCTTCQHKFCWMCLGAFDHKDHACNKLSEEADPTTERALLNKFIHFYSRFQTHQQSSELEDKLLGVAEATMRELSERGAPWIDVQYIKQATLALVEARGMLKYTYVYGYFLPNHVNRSIFEYLQADLERAVERLSGMLEANGDKERLKVINSMEYVKQRQKNLLEGLAEGDIGGLGGRDSEQNYKNSVQKYDGWVYNTGR